MKLEIKNITTGYHTGKNRKTVLQQNIRATLQTGELICVLGPNGAGKSTLLRTLAGFMKPLSGEIFIDGKSLKKTDLKSLARLISVVLTDRFSDMYLTAFDVVRTGRFPYVSFFGKMRENDLQFITTTMQKLGINNLRNKLFYNLSDGEKQKTLIARALVQDTPVLMLDEPVAFIDSPGRIEIMELLTTLAHQQQKAVLMTTHDMETALHYADFLWLIQRDKPLHTGIPEDLVLQKKVEACFDHPGLVFDMETGRFRAKHLTQKYAETLFLSGTGTEMLWLKKALERNGFRVEITDQTDDRPFSVCFKNGNFILKDNTGKTGKHTSIASVLQKLKKQCNPLPDSG